jgi:hypothetical protein
VACAPGAQFICYDGPSGTQDVGTCKSGSHTCKPDGTGFGPCVGQVLPAVDKCSTPEDEDCNGASTPCVSDVIWSKQFGASGQFNFGSRVALDAAGNIILLLTDAQNLDLGGGPVSGLVMVKLDATGQFIWSKSFGVGARWVDVAIDGAGNILVTGAVHMSVDFGGGPFTLGGGGELGFAAKLTPQGAHVWSKLLGSLFGEGGGVAVDAQGNAFVGGQFGGSINLGGGVLQASSNSDLFFAKFDPSGAHIWSKKGHALSGNVQRISVDTTGNLLLTGWYSDGLDFGNGPLPGMGGTGDLFLAKLDGTGAPIFVKHFGDADTQQDCRAVIDAAGNIVLTGVFRGSLNFGGGPLAALSTDTFLAKLDPMGNHVWSESFGNMTAMNGGGMAVDAAGDIFVGGAFQGTVDFGAGKLMGAGSQDGYLAKYSPGGSALWTKRYGAAQADVVTDVVVTSTGAPLITGGFPGKIDFGAGPLTAIGTDDVFLVELMP